MSTDYDVRGSDLRSYYAGFTRRSLPEGALWRLSMASSLLPQDHPGFMAWMTVVSDTERFRSALYDWAIGLAETIAHMKPRLKARRREYVASYDESWGRQAAADGLNMAIYGLATVPAIAARAAEFGCDRDAYKRIREFVAGALLLTIWQFEDALRWSHRVARDA